MSATVMSWGQSPGPVWTCHGCRRPVWGTVPGTCLERSCPGARRRRRPYGPAAVSATAMSWGQSPGPVWNGHGWRRHVLGTVPRTCRKRACPRARPERPPRAARGRTRGCGMTMPSPETIDRPRAQTRFYGKYRGTVVNNVDPLQIGRIQAIVPDVSALIPTSWALPCLPGAGINSGVFTVPQIGSGVWIEFEQGDPDRPLWVGGYWGTAAEVPLLAHTVPPAVNGFTIQ